MDEEVAGIGSDMWLQGDESGKSVSHGIVDSGIFVESEHVSVFVGKKDAFVIGFWIGEGCRTLVGVESFWVEVADGLIEESGFSIPEKGGTRSVDLYDFAVVVFFERDEENIFRGIGPVFDKDLLFEVILFFE